MIFDRLQNLDLEELIVWVTVLAMLLAVAYYVIDKVRKAPSQSEPTASELISKFRDLHSRGELSDEEFRTIRTTLAAQMQEELKDMGETGYDE